MNDELTVEELLVEAKAHLKDGEAWMKGGYGTTSTVGENHRHCMLGALICVEGQHYPERGFRVEVTDLQPGNTLSQTVVNVVAQPILKELTDGYEVSIVRYNDEMFRKWDEIDKFLDKCIAKAGELGL